MFALAAVEVAIPVYDVSAQTIRLDQLQKSSPYKMTIGDSQTGSGYSSYCKLTKTKAVAQSREKTTSSPSVLC